MRNGMTERLGKNEKESGNKMWQESKQKEKENESIGKEELKENDMF